MVKVIRDFLTIQQVKKAISCKKLKQLWHQRNHSHIK